MEACIIDLLDVYTFTSSVMVLLPKFHYFGSELTKIGHRIVHKTWSRVATSLCLRKNFKRQDLEKSTGESSKPSFKWAHQALIVNSYIIFSIVSQNWVQSKLYYGPNSETFKVLSACLTRPPFYFKLARPEEITSKEVVEVAHTFRSYLQPNRICLQNDVLIG